MFSGGIESTVCRTDADIYEERVSFYLNVGLSNIPVVFKSAIGGRERITYYQNIVNSLYDDIQQGVIDGIRELQIAETRKVSAKGGCYIATCLYGSYDCPEVWVLRRFRDNILVKNILGRLFVHTYYFISPVLVQYLGEKKLFKKTFAYPIDKLVQMLHKRGFEDTPYQDREW